MAHAPEEETRPGWIHRLLRAIPIVGTVTREVEKNINVLFIVIAVAVILEILAFMTWGPVALTLTGLFGVVFMYYFFVCISWPFAPKKKD